MIPSDKLETINDADGYHDICPVCYPLFDQCGLCGNEYLKPKLHKINDEWYCEDCLPKYIAQLEGEEKAQAMRQLNASLVGAAAGLAIFHGLNAKNKRGNDQLSGLSEAQFDDGYPDDYVGDGLDGADDYVGDGLDS